MTQTKKDLEETLQAIEVKQAKSLTDLRKINKYRSNLSPTALTSSNSSLLSHTYPVVNLSKPKTYIKLTRFPSNQPPIQLKPGTVIVFQTVSGKTKYGLISRHKYKPDPVIKLISSSQAKKYAHINHQSITDFQGLETRKLSEYSQNIDPLHDPTIQLIVIAMTTLLAIMIVDIIFQIIFNINLI